MLTAISYQLHGAMEGPFLFRTGYRLSVYSENKYHSIAKPTATTKGEPGAVAAALLSYAKAFVLPSI